MKKLKYFAMIAAIVLLIAGLSACEKTNAIIQEPAGEEYVYFNPDETKAKTDEGMKIDGILDETVYNEKNWIYLSNDDGGNNVNIAMTSHFGEQGMYIVFDVTESVPIYVNLERAPTLNSCVELYLAPPHVTKINTNTMFEIDLLPTGDMSFKQSNGKYGYTNVTTSDDIMAYLGATTKGGEVNTPECYGYVLELFIPWDYMQWLGQDVEAMKNGHVLINPAHITSNNLMGTNHDLDRYWYHYAQQIGTDFTNVAQYFRFNGEGVMGSTEIALVEGEHYSFEGNNVALPGMQIPLTIIPEEGYALTSILVDGQERITRASFNQDGSVTVLVRCSGEGQSVSAVAEAVTAGNKTLTGKLFATSVPHEAFEGFAVSYVGPTGEKPVKLDAEGNFEIKDLEPGFYTLRVERNGYAATTRGVYVNRDMYVELVFKTSVFEVTGGACWILDDESAGILHKVNGAGNIISKDTYNDFTLETHIKYDPELAKQSKDDFYLQQRSGVRILFSNGKYWHIDLMYENGNYIVQYAKHTGNDSLYSWKNIHTLTADQIEKYCSADGIKLTVVRVGNQVAICLEDEVLVVEKLASQYKDYTAQVGFEAWIANGAIMQIPYSLSGSAKLPPAPITYWNGADTWDVKLQNRGVVYKTGVAGKDTWLDAAVNANDITTNAKDRSPETNDYSMIYIFKFSNGEQFRVRLNHTDNDGKYRIQSMARSTVFEAWKNHYTLNEEQEQLVKTEGINFRVWIYGTTAYVYLEDQQVCTYDLSTVVATGQPSGIEKATVRVSLRLDGNIGKSTAVPFILRENYKAAEEEKPEQPSEPEKPIDPDKLVTLNIGQMTNGTVTPDKTAYAVGDTIALTIAPASGYAQKLYINGEPLLLDWKNNTYSFVATEKVYEITGGFVSNQMRASDANRWDGANQAHGLLSTYYPNNNDSWWTDINGEYKAITAKVKNYLSLEDSKDGNGKVGFAFVLRVTMDNGKFYAFRIINDKGTYAHDHFGASGAATNWGTWKALDSASAAALNGEGVTYKLERTGANTLTLSVNGVVMETYTMAGVTADNKVVSMGMTLYGNQGKHIQIPYTLTAPTEEPPVEEDLVELKLPEVANGTVTADKESYKLGDTITLTVSVNAGYTQKLYINGEPLLLDWKSNTYSFVATEESYEITGGFVSNQMRASDANRWDGANQAHGLLSTYYPNNNDSWWTDINGEYKAITAKVKNYLSLEDSKDGNGKVGFAFVLRVTMDNGKFYAFRIINDKGTYAHDHFGASGAATNWGTWKALDSASAAALNGEGVTYKLERTGANTLTLSVNGVVMETYTMAGVTADNKVVSMGMTLYGNQGKHIQIPYTLTAPTEEPPVEEDLVELKLPEVANGTVTADKESYKQGDTITLTVSVNAGYTQKLYINGEPLMLNWKTNSYSFVATEESYEITGGFVSNQMSASDVGRWDTANQAHGVINTYYPNESESWWMDINGDYTSITAKVKNYLSLEDSKDGNGKVGFAFVLRITLDNGKFYAFRIINDKGTYAHDHFGASGASTNWGTWKALDSAAAAALNGEGVTYKLERTGANTLTLSVNGVVMETYTMAGVTADNKVVSVGMRLYGNQGQHIQIPYSVG